MTFLQVFLLGGIAGLAQVLPATVGNARDPVPSLTTQTVSASAAELFVIAEIALQRGHRNQAGQLFEVLSHDPNPDVRNEARFRQALLMEQDGQDRQAAVLLRRVMDDKPDAVAPRLKLAAILQRMGEDDAALRELRALGSSNLPRDVARFVDQLATNLQMTKRFGFQIEAAVAPDTNINRATTSETIGTIFGDFEIDEEAKSGMGIALRGSARARKDAGDQFSLSARISGEAILYGHPQFNDISLGVAAGPQLSLGRTRISAEAGVAQQWFGMNRFQRTMGVSGSIVHRVSPTSQLRFEPGLRWTNDQINDLRDGRGLSASIRYERALSPRLVVAVRVSADRYKAMDDAYSTRSWLLGMAAYRDMGRMTLTASADFGRLNADDRLLILPQARSDNFTRVSVGGVFRHLTIAGFAPLFRATLERNRSTVAFYDFKRSRTEFGVSRAF